MVREGRYGKSRGGMVRRGGIERGGRDGKARGGLVRRGEGW